MDVTIARKKIDTVRMT